MNTKKTEQDSKVLHSGANVEPDLGEQYAKGMTRWKPNGLRSNTKGGCSERYILGKPHPDRAKQFKPFAALRGYEDLVEKVMERAAESHDFSGLDEPC